jgi:hypothetical protein
MAKDNRKTPPPDPTQDILFREIEEDLRTERYASLWNRYSALIIGAAVALVLGVAGYEVWKGMEQSAREAASEQYLTAAADVAADPAAARAAFAELAAEGPPGYALVAGLREAATLRQAGDALAAAGAYERIVGSAEDPLHADLARLLGVMAELEGPAPPADPDGLRERLLPLAEGDGPWRHSAREMIAFLELRTADAARAHALFAALAEDPTAPASLRTRAARMAATLGDG